MLHNRKVDRILFQTDSLDVVQAIQKKTSKNQNSTLVRRILKLLQNKKRWVIRHILKEANHVDDLIIKMVYVDLKGLNVMEITPMELLEALDSDKTSGAFDIVSLT
ncbi:hypothetical protein Gohar_024595 [Gossypium harknessii]|uniref:RNase H type-1 domain-containing protein n=1 Tax=Gossypium harknessii TaxID=34285 RepID=A0A7J9HHL4_9ROSI|nr:hypothetical protein [Gossypium harknessii]